MPFKKGQSGNPKGRPKNTKTFTEVLRQEADELLKDQGITKYEALAKVLFSKAGKGDLKAIDMIMDRIDGKPRQAVELSGDENKPVVSEVRRVIVDKPSDSDS